MCKVSFRVLSFSIIERHRQLWVLWCSVSRKKVGHFDCGNKHTFKSFAEFHLVSCLLGFVQFSFSTFHQWDTSIHSFIQLDQHRRKFSLFFVCIQIWFSHFCVFFSLDAILEMMKWETVKWNANIILDEIVHKLPITCKYDVYVPSFHFYIWI